jgi:hypothetical protein
MGFPKEHDLEMVGKTHISVRFFGRVDMKWEKKTHRKFPVKILPRKNLSI